MLIGMRLVSCDDLKTNFQLIEVSHSYLPSFRAQLAKHRAAQPYLGITLDTWQPAAATNQRDSMLCAMDTCISGVSLFLS